MSRLTRSHPHTASRPEASSLSVPRRMQATPRRDTQCELALRSVLPRPRLRPRVDRRLPDARRRADLTFVRARVVVFVDGCFWHGCPQHASWPKSNAEGGRPKDEMNRRREIETSRKLRRAGWKVVRVWEHEDPHRASQRWVAAIGETSSPRR